MIDLEAIRARISQPTGNEDAQDLLAYVDELREAAGKVTCIECSGDGRLTIYETLRTGSLESRPIGDEPCPDCAPLRQLLGESP